MRVIVPGHLRPAGEAYDTVALQNHLLSADDKVARRTRIGGVDQDEDALAGRPDEHEVGPVAAGEGDVGLVVERDLRTRVPIQTFDEPLDVRKRGRLDLFVALADSMSELRA